MPHRLSLGDCHALLFDVDGTLVDSLGMIVPGLADSIEKFSGVRPADSEIQALVGMPIQAQLLQFLPKAPDESAMGEMVEYTISRYERYKDRETIFAPAIQLLQRCSNLGIKTALVTSKNARELELFMNRFIGAEWVDATVCASDVLHPKPAPDAALLALRKLSVQPERALFIGDSIFDMRCAKGAGVAAIAVAYGSATAEALQAEDPDALFLTPEELLDWAEATLPKRNGPQEINDRFIDIDSSRNSSAGAA